MATTEGNLGAVSVFLQFMTKDTGYGFALMEYCNKTGIRGSQLLLDYDKFNKDMDKYIEHVLAFILLKRDVN